MRSEGLLTILIIVFIFCLWLYTGGPNHPISFAGPYLTPITNVGQVSTGYGQGFTWKDAAHTVSVGGISASYKPGSSEAAREALFSNPSSYRGKIVIQDKSHLTRAQGPWDEFVHLYVTNNLTGSVDLTGWKLVSPITGASVNIPQGAALAQENGTGALSDIVVSAGTDLYIGTYTSPLRQSFRENKCTGYLTENHTFSPRLYSSSCPTPHDEFNSSFNGGGEGSYDKCQNYLYTLSSCVVPSITPPKETPFSCVTFAKSRLSYTGCVGTHYGDTDFTGKVWHVYLGRNTLVWKIPNDTIKLLDAEGKTVDVYSY